MSAVDPPPTSLPDDVPEAPAYATDSGVTPHTTTGTATPLRRFWWLRMVLGGVAVVVGLLALAWPEATITVIAVLFGLNLLVEGLVRVVQAILTPAVGTTARFGYGLLGIISVVIGVLCLRNLLQTVAVLTLLVGLFWLITGLIEIIVALSAGPPARWTARTAMELLIGGVSLAAGVIVLAYPGVSLTTLAVLLGLSLVLYGAASILDAVRLRSAPAT